MSKKAHLCKNCEEKEPSKFYKGRKTICKSCLIDQESSRWKTNFDSIKDKVKERNVKNVLKYRLTSAKNRAIKNHLLFDIDLNFLEQLQTTQNNKCAYSNMEFNNYSSLYSVSLDRKDPNKGYTKDNVQLVCSSVNYMKNDLSEKDFLDIISNIYATKVQQVRLELTAF